MAAACGAKAPVDSTTTLYEKSAVLGVYCTNFRTIEIIEKLEKDAQIPVVTSVQATLWNYLRKIHCNEPIPGYGKLLRITDE